MGTTTPLVTVLMPVYNGEQYLREAMESILHQTYTNFEFLIINDGSTDDTREIILSYTDPRIVYVENATNLKLIATLNKGLDLARGRYIVRMDADDMALPTRIEKQVQYMESETGIAAAGCWIKVIDGGDQQTVQFDPDPDMIRIRMLFSCYMNHPSVILRRSVLEQFHLRYPTAYLHAEDYALWVELLAVSELGMVSDYLLQYRVHEEQIGSKHYDTQRDMTLALRRKQLERLTAVSEEEFRLFNSFVHYTMPEFFTYPNPAVFRQAGEFLTLGALLSRLIESNRVRHLYSPDKFARFLAVKWKQFCLDHTTPGAGVYRAFFDYGFQAYAPVRLHTRLLFFMKTRLHLPAFR